MNGTEAARIGADAQRRTDSRGSGLVYKCISAQKDPREITVEVGQYCDRHGYSAPYIEPKASYEDFSIFLFRYSKMLLTSSPLNV